MNYYKFLTLRASPPARGGEANHAKRKPENTEHRSKIKSKSGPKTAPKTENTENLVKIRSKSGPKAAPEPQGTRKKHHCKKNTKGVPRGPPPWRDFEKNPEFLATRKSMFLTWKSWFLGFQVFLQDDIDFEGLLEGFLYGFCEILGRREYARMRFSCGSGAIFTLVA